MGKRQAWEGRNEAKPECRVGRSQRESPKLTGKKKKRWEKECCRFQQVGSRKREKKKEKKRGEDGWEYNGKERIKTRGRVKPKFIREAQEEKNNINQINHTAKPNKFKYSVRSTS